MISCALKIFKQFELASYMIPCEKKSHTNAYFFLLSNTMLFEITGVSMKITVMKLHLVKFEIKTLTKELYFQCKHTDKIVLLCRVA